MSVADILKRFGGQSQGQGLNQANAERLAAALLEAEASDRESVAMYHRCRDRHAQTAPLRDAALAVIRRRLVDYTDHGPVLRDLPNSDDLAALAMAARPFIEPVSATAPSGREALTR